MTLVSSYRLSCQYIVDLLTERYATIITKFPRRGQIPTNPEKGSNVENPENGFNPF
jgi:hypothetical protein